MPRQKKNAKKPGYSTIKSEKKYTQLVDLVIEENVKDETSVKRYKKNRLAYILAIFSLVLLIALVAVLITAIVLKWI